MISTIWTDPTRRPTTDVVWQRLNQIISLASEGIIGTTPQVRTWFEQIISETVAAKKIIAYARGESLSGEEDRAGRAEAEARNKANPIAAALPPGVQPATPALVEWDALREQCRRASESYLDHDQFFTAWKKFVKRARAAGQVSESGYPQELVAALLCVIEQRQGFWANPN